MSARLTFGALARSYIHAGRSVRALGPVDLNLEPGSFTAVVGPSGSGKSTLLHIAAGLDTQYEGSFKRMPAQARLACLFQQPRLLPWLTARDNVAFVLEATGTPRTEALARADSVLSMVGLRDAAAKFPAHLSGGMQQRVSLARALVIDPDVLLMDEPFSALDELTAARLRSELASLSAVRGRTVLLVTHNIQEACYLADRVVVLSGQPGTVKAIFGIDLPRPRDPLAPSLATLARQVLASIDPSQTDPSPDAPLPLSSEGVLS
jgi:ABC-type nitrate/sulfonate/bicarbonate transport system ATPase subunit